MKFWGARIVERLFSAKADKRSDAAVDEAPTELNATEQAKPARGKISSEKNVGKPHELKALTALVQKTNEKADKNTMLRDGLGGKTVSDEQDDISNTARKIGHGFQERESSSALTQKRLKAKGQVSAPIDPENRAKESRSPKKTIVSQELFNDVDLLKVDHVTVNNSAIDDYSEITVRSSQKQKSETDKLIVSDKELAELEAENARLKRLLRERMDTN